MSSKAGIRTFAGLLALTLTTTFMSVPEAQALIRLAPQTLVDHVLGQGYDARAIQLNAQKAELGLARTRGAFDWGLIASTDYELTRLESLLGLTNLEDINRNFNLGFTKAFSSGTNFTLKYRRTYQNSVTSSFLNTAHPPDQTLDAFDLGVRQDLLTNFFGVQDRRRLRIAERDLQRADLLRRESMESLVLDAITVYWKTYVSEANLRESIEAREKYQLLIKSVERKVRLGLAEPPDLAKVKIEYTAQDRRVKGASLQYLADLDRLFSVARLPYDKDLQFEVSLDFPSPTDEGMPATDELRPVRSAQLAVDSAQDALNNARLNTLPKLTLFGQLGFNGVDQQPSEAFSELSSGVHPRYLVGVEVSYPLWSENLRGEVRQSEVLRDEALNELSRSRENREIELKQAERSVRSNYIMARMAKDAVAQWEKVIVDRERLFQNARVGTAEIIQDYSLYFRAKSDLVSTVADYYFSLHRLRAAKDELVP